MKKAATILAVLGVIGTLWGTWALFLAANNYTPETSGLGRGVPALSISYSRDANGNQSPSPEEEAQLFADDLAKRDAAVATHKMRGKIMLGIGVVLLAAGIVLKIAQRKK